MEILLQSYHILYVGIILGSHIPGKDMTPLIIEADM